jgi:hypothetical protein
MAARERMSSLVSSPGTLASATWTVIGMTRRLGPASIITALVALIPQASATNSVWPGKSKPTSARRLLAIGAVTSRRRTAAHEPGCHFETAQGERRSGCIGLAGGIVAFADVEHGQGLVEGLERFLRGCDRGHPRMEAALASRFSMTRLSRRP